MPVLQEKFMYEATLLSLSRDTRFRLSEAPAEPVSERRNPACGDEVALAADLSCGRVQELKFYAQGCAVCVASATALCETLNGLPAPEALRRVEQGLRFFRGKGEWIGEWGHPSLPALGAVRAKPMRMACVLLAWEGLKEALES